MAAYMIARIRVTNPDEFAKYREAVPRVIEQYGGRYLVRGGDVRTLEGSYDGRRWVLFEFPSMEAIQRFWESPEYAAVKELRVNAADVDIWAVPGVGA